jgi:hypothetical protein
LFGKMTLVKRRVKADEPLAHCNLAESLTMQGRFEEALARYQQGHEPGLKQPDWRYPSAQWVRDAERLVALDRKLPAVLKGQGQPADAAECLAFAKLCRLKKLFRAAARVYADAFVARPELVAEVLSPPSPRRRLGRCLDGRRPG